MIASIFISAFILWRYFFEVNYEEISSIAPGVLIEEALKYELPTIDGSLDNKEADEHSWRAFERVKAGDYKGAFEKAFEVTKKFPHYFNSQVYFAMIFGDYSSHFSGELKEKIIQKSKSMFNKLKKEVTKQPKHIYYWFMNEYNYRFSRFKDQYELGLQRVKDYWQTKDWNTYGFKGYYSQGVGASNYAKELLLKDEKKLAHDYAQKALVAWAQYFTYKNDYYNAYVHFALALGILGYKKEMERALVHAADIIKKDLNFPEFKEVIEFVNEAEKKDYR